MFLERTILVAEVEQEGGVETGDGKPVSRFCGIWVRADGLSRRERKPSVHVLA